MFLDTQNTDLDLLGEEVEVNGVEINDDADYLAFVEESEQSWGNLQATMMRAEHYAFVNEDTVLLEASVGEYWDRVVEWFKKVWAAVKQFFSNIWMKISALWTNRQKWVLKYSKAIDAGASKIKGTGKVVKSNTINEKYQANIDRNTLEAVKEATASSLKSIREMNVTFEMVQLNAGHVKAAKEEIARLDGYAKAIRLIASNEIKAAKDGISTAKSAKGKAGATESKQDLESIKIAGHRATISVQKALRSKLISAGNAIGSAAFSITRKSASAGARGTKAAFKAGKMESNTNEDSVLSQFEN